MTRFAAATLAAALSSVPLPVVAQGPPSGAVKGTVVDESGGPLEGATITVQGVEGAPHTATTGSSGAYVFEALPPGAYRVSVALVGFGPQSEHVVVEPGAPTEARFTLRLLLLEELVASASTKVKKVRDAPATVYVVSDTMIRERGYSYLFDALRDAPGLDIVWMGGLYGPIVMPRGLDSQENNRIILLVDGVVDNNLSAGTAQIYMQYSLHNVKRIEIIYGPASALYGANAMAALVNIITRTGEDIKGLRVQAGGIAWDAEGRRTGRLANLAVGKAWGAEGRKVDVSASFHVIDTDGSDLRIDADLPRSDLPGNPGAAAYYFSPDHIGSAEKGTYMAQAKARFERIGLRLNAFVWQHDGGQGTYGHEGFVFLNGLQNRPDVWNYRNIGLNASFDRKLGERFANTLALTYRDTRITDGFDVYFNTTGTGPDGAGSPPNSGSRYFRPDHTFKAEDSVTWDMSSKMTLTAGLSAEFQYVSDYQLCPGTACPSGSTGAQGHTFANQTLLSEGPRPTADQSLCGQVPGACRRYNYNDYSAYLEHIWSVSEKLSLTTGLRFDSFKLTGRETPFFFGTNDVNAAGVCPADRPACKTAAEAAAANAAQVSRVYYKFLSYDKTRATVNPRLGAVLSLMDRKLTLKGLYGEGFRMPTVRELFSVSGSRFSNPDLDPEKIRTGEVSATYQLPDDKGVLELDAFYTKANRGIVLTPGTVRRPGRTTFLNQFQNVAEPRIYGFDLKAHVTAAKSFDVFGYYSFQVPEYERIDAGNRSHDPDTASLTDSKDRIPRQASHKGMIGASAYLLNRRLVITPRLNWVGERPQVITSPLQEAPAYQSFNLSASLRDVGVKGLFVQAVLHNLANEDILDPGFRTANKSNDFPSAHPQPGFHTYFKVGYRKDF